MSNIIKVLEEKLGITISIHNYNYEQMQELIRKTIIYQEKVNNSKQLIEDLKVHIEKLKTEEP